METEIKLRGFEDYRIIEHIVLEHQDMKATNQKQKRSHSALQRNVFGKC